VLKQILALLVYQPVRFPFWFGFAVHKTILLTIVRDGSFIKRPQNAPTQEFLAFTVSVAILISGND
jgi:hypothetical protein